MGYVRQVSFQAGDRVRAGQLLVELDARDLDTQVRQAEGRPARGRGGAAGGGQRHRIGQGQPGTGPGDLPAHAGPVPEEVHFQPGVRRGLGASEGGPGRLRDGGGQAQAGRRQGQPGGRGHQDAANIMRGVRPDHGSLRRSGDREARRAGQPGHARRASGDIEREGAYRLEASVEESRVRDDPRRAERLGGAGGAGSHPGAPVSARSCRRWTRLRGPTS